MRRWAVAALAAAMVLGACGGRAGDVGLVTPPATGGEQGQSLERIVPTAKAWIKALHDGDMEAAWTLTAEPSRERIGPYERFASMRAELAEGWGRWASAADVRFSVASLASSDAEEASVVTMVGRVAGEGPARREAAALAVRTVQGVSRVTPFEGQRRINIARPTEGAAEDAATLELEAFVPAVPSVIFAIDGLARTPELAGADGDQHRATLRPQPLLAAGEHVLTVAFVDGGGFLEADAVVFNVR